MLYGGDYNPEQWPEDVWHRDMDLLRGAGINEVTLNVFAWARLQPSEQTYDFTRLDRITDTVTEAGLSIVMATATGALPAWMALRHPDVNRVDEQGRQMRHGQRHNACINSPTYRRYSTELAARLAQRYAGLPTVVAWHVSNEYGGFCWCDRCAVAFRAWLHRRYQGDIEAVNEAWNSEFWSHTYHSFEEIFAPNELGDLMPGGGRRPVLPAASLDYRRFYGQSVLESFREEKQAIRRFDQVHPVTTNFMGTFPDYDYFEWSEDLDVVSWDSYPAHDTTPSEVALRHDLMRAVGGQRPFLLMEQTPSRQNWQAENSLKRPGQMRQQSWQAIAHGADSVQFFQLRQSRSGCEKFHGAVIGADGSDRTRTYQEVAALGAELARVSPRILGSRPERARVALVFDWPSRWAIGFSAGPTRSLDYVHEVQRWYDELHGRGIAVDLVRATGPFDGYTAVLAPCLYMTGQPVATALRAFVEAGGRLLLTPMSGLVDTHDSLFQGEAPVPLRDLAGVWVEETDALPPAATVPLRGTRSDGGEGTELGQGEILCDIVHADPGTQVLAEYGGEFYAGTPALTFRPVAGGGPRASSASPEGDEGGSGGVVYSATFPVGAALGHAVDALLEGTGVEGAELPHDVEVNRRVCADGTVLTFVVNCADGPVGVDLDLRGRDLLTEAEVDGHVDLSPFGVAVVE